MKRNRVSHIPFIVCTILAIITLLPSSSRAQATGTVIYSFGSGSTDGIGPHAGLVSDAAHNFYGTTDFGGAAGKGTVFQLTPTATGWTETVLYSFTGGADGANPNFAGVILDKAGNLYGTTYYGGTPSAACTIGCGVVFELSPTSSGWQETVLHAFNNTDGAAASGGLIFDPAGNLYGATGLGGPNTTGVIFKLTPSSAGTWTESVLYDFPVTPKSSVNPWSVAMDSTGNLYGTAVIGGAYGFGSVFKLVPNSTGGWTKSIIHSFIGGKESGFSRTRLTFDSAGNIYGMTSGQPGGAGSGAVFKLVPTSAGGWKSVVLHTFTGGKDGGNPSYDQLIFDSAGNLYGTTLRGGNLNTCSGYGCGVVFKLTPTANGEWRETVLHTFFGNRKTGGNPNGVIMDTTGILRGTADVGGANGAGVVFQITP